jgi:hypothetical protein
MLVGKPESVIFIPAPYDPKRDPGSPVNLANFSTLVPFTDALMDEDPTLFEYLIDPDKKSYSIDVLGVRSLAVDHGQLRRFVLPSIRRGVRYSTRNTDRLHRAERLPWKAAFEELRRVVLECHRYPKVNDAWVVGSTPLSLSLFYRYARKGYMLYQSGEDASYLQPHQIADLESLPMWTQYGVHGPYIWGECFDTLSQYVAVHKKFPPLDIHKGGYVGLDATPFERLSGALCNVNQQDAHDRCLVSARKQQDLDDLCGKFNLRWRKRRKGNGKLYKHATSCITESYQEFKLLYAQKEPAFMKYVQENFPGYPKKHQQMEKLEVQQSGKAPPRRKVLSEVFLKKRQCAHEKKGSLFQHIDVGDTTVAFCRVCRINISASRWNDHVQSQEHQERIRLD